MVLYAEIHEIEPSWNCEFAKHIRKLVLELGLEPPEKSRGPDA